MLHNIRIATVCMASLQYKYTDNFQYDLFVDQITNS